MSPFWTYFYDHLKDCGRNATLFLVTLPFVLGLMALAAALFEHRVREYLVPASPVLAVVAVVWFWVAYRRMRARRRERLERGRLSEDELRVARAKLTKTRR